MGKPELLAPAGDYACFQAALKAGADAVYLGGRRYGARAFAGNFSEEEVVEALKEAHFYGRKIYLTVNTLMRQEELDSLEEFIAPFWEAGLDGAIVQDVGALSVLKECFPALPLHASTQMAITDAAGAEALKELGIARVVPARELSLEEVAALRRESGLEVEVFIHGAMCYSYSGQCLFSSFLGGRSGNRGRCAQPCRQPYRIVDEHGKGYPGKNASSGRSREKGHSSREKEGVESFYPLSLKDMCTLDILPQLMEAGVDSFKIEGRMKKPEYVAGVTSVYRERIDALSGGADLGRGRPVSSDFADSACETQGSGLLHSLYIRSGPGDGYYSRHNGREMITLTQPGYAGTDEEILDRIRREVMEPPLEVPVFLEAILREGEPGLLHAWDEEGNVVSVQGDGAAKAQKRPVTEEEVEKQLRKSGGSGFYVKELRVEMDEDIFLPIRSLNELRRSALDALREKRITAHMSSCLRRNGGERDDFPSGKTKFPKECKLPGEGELLEECKLPGECEFSREGELPRECKLLGKKSGCKADRPIPAFHVTAATPKQLDACLSAGVSRIYLPAFRVDESLIARLKLLMEESSRASLCRDINKQPELFLSLPVIWRKETQQKRSYIKELLETGWFTGVQVGSLSALTWLERQGWKGRVAFDHRIYIWNRQTLEFWKDRMDTWCAPLELNRRDVYALVQEKGPENEVFAYGRVPMMVTANCIYKTLGKCGEDSGECREGALEDRYKVRFPVRTDCRFCYNIIYNSVPVSLHAYGKEMAQNGVSALRLDFLEEDGRETESILASFHAALAGKEYEVSYPFTTGHFKKGAQ